MQYHCVIVKTLMESSLDAGCPRGPSRCDACGRDATMRCGRCQKVSYCSAACQKRDWKERHRVHCPARRKAAEARGECEFCRKPKADCVCG